MTVNPGLTNPAKVAPHVVADRRPCTDPISRGPVGPVGFVVPVPRRSAPSMCSRSYVSSTPGRSNHMLSGRAGRPCPGGGHRMSASNFSDDGHIALLRHILSGIPSPERRAGPRSSDRAQVGGYRGGGQHGQVGRNALRSRSRSHACASIFVHKRQRRRR